jgi:pimeloyl-ACP methyl ester carboxylesterase
VLLVPAGLAFYAYRVARRVEAIVPPIGRYVEVDGTRLHYVDRGAGAPIVMIHGIAANLRHYTSTILEELANTNRVIAIDRPGCGYSDRPSGPWSAETQAALIQKALETLGIAKPLIVGHSLGGSVALAHALNHPGTARGYVLIAPLTGMVEKPTPLAPRRVAAPLMQHLIAWTIGIPMAIKYGPGITAFVFAPQLPPKDFATASGALLGLRPKSIVTNLRDAAFASETAGRLQQRYGEIDAPVLCLYGTKDQVLEPDYHLSKLDALHSAEIQLLDGAGHMLMHVEPDAVIGAVRRMDERTGAGQDAAASA